LVTFGALETKLQAERTWTSAVTLELLTPIAANLLIESEKYSCKIGAVVLYQQAKFGSDCKSHAAARAEGSSFLFITLAKSP